MALFLMLIITKSYNVYGSTSDEYWTCEAYGTVFSTHQFKSVTMCCPHQEQLCSIIGGTPRTGIYGGINYQCEQFGDSNSMWCFDDSTDTGTPGYGRYYISHVFHGCSGDQIYNPYKDDPSVDYCDDPCPEGEVFLETGPRCGPPPPPDCENCGPTDPGMSGGAGGPGADQPIGSPGGLGGIGRPGSTTGPSLPPLTGDDGGCLGNPCYAGSGNKFQIETDYSVPSTGLSVVRYYNSLQALDPSNDYGFGVGWSSNLTQHLDFNYDYLTHTSATGKQETYTIDHVEGTSPTSNPGGEIRGDGDAEITIRTPSNSGKFELTYPNGLIQVYDDNGRLERARNSQIHYTLYYDYNAFGDYFRLITEYGHGLTYYENVDGQIERITDPNNRDYLYEYDQNNLVKVTYPDGFYREYFYDDPNFPHLLTGIRDENGNIYATFSYDAQGRVISTEHATTLNNGVLNPQEKFEIGGYAQ